MSIYVHLCCSMGDMLIIQMGRKQISTKWGHILSGVAFEFNCIIGKTHILCGRGTLYIYISLYMYNIYMCIYNIICMYGHGYSPRSGNHRWRNGAKVSEDVVHRGNCYDVIYNESGGPKNMGQLLVRPIQYVGFSSPLKDPGWGWLNHAETGKDTNLI